MKRGLSGQNIETDSYDRGLFGDLESESEGLGDLIGRGSSLLPGFRALMLDLFAAFYKHNVVFLPEECVRRGSSCRGGYCSESGETWITPHSARKPCSTRSGPLSPPCRWGS
jgi:hypothetical protein